MDHKDNIVSSGMLGWNQIEPGKKHPSTETSSSICQSGYRVFEVYFWLRLKCWESKRHSPPPPHPPRKKKKKKKNENPSWFALHPLCSVLARRAENSVDWTTLCGSHISRATDTLTLLFSCFIITVLTLLPFLKFSSGKRTFWFWFFKWELRKTLVHKETKPKKTRNCKIKWMFCSEIEFWLSAFFSTYFPKKCFQASLTGSPTLPKCTSLQMWRSPDGVSWSVPSGATTLHSADLLLGRCLPTPATFRRKLTARRNHPCTFLSTQRKVSTCFYTHSCILTQTSTD